MTFGLIKSVIENSLIESYKDEKSFKKSLLEFRQNILNNKDLSKVYSLYDELSNPKGLTEQDAKEFVNEGIQMIQSLLQQIKLPKLMTETKVQNRYQDIDDLVYLNKKIDLSERVSLKKKLYKTLSESEIKNQKPINIPLSTMVRVANQTVQNYIESLDENTKKEFFELIKEDSESLESRFNLLKEKTLKKLSPVLENEADIETKQKIQETIDKIQNDKFNQINFLRLKKLEESI